TSEDLSTNPEPEISEPLRDLNSELFWAVFEARVSEAETDLCHEDLSARLEDEPSEALKYSVRPLKKELTRLNESLSDLKNEYFSTRLEASPSDALRDLAYPLV